MPFTITPLPGIPIIQSGEDLASIILTSLPQAEISLTDGDIIVLVQKIVSKCEASLTA